MNRLLKSFFGLTLGVAFSLGVAASLNANKSTNVEKAEAADWASGNTVYLRIFKAFFDNVSGTHCYLRYNSSSGWKNYSVGTKSDAISLLGGDNTYYYFKYTFTTKPDYNDIYIKRYDSVPSGDVAWNSWAISRTYTSNLMSVDGWYSGNDGSATYASASLCNYHFQTPTNGTVAVSVKDSSDTSKGNISQGNSDNYIYSNWKVTLTPTASTGYGFSHWTESENSGSTYVAWSGDDIRTNPVTLTSMSGNVYHGVSFKQYKTVYYVTDKTTATSDRIYAWTNYSTASGNKDVLEYGSWDECWAITATTNASEVFSDGIVHFRGLQNKIYKFSLFSDNFIIRYDSATKQTGDFSTNNGSAYYTEGENADAGAAIALIEAEETARNSVTASGSIKKYSICGIDKTTAQSLVNTYNSGISATAREYVNASTTYTYIGDGTNVEKDISFASIFNQLSKIATGGSKSPLLNWSFSGNDSGILIVVIVSALGILSIGAYYFFRKSRKAEE